MPETREREMRRWLRRVLGAEPQRLEPASEDASFRRYLRVTVAGGATSILMDAPPSHEDCRPFVDVARRLAGAGLRVPTVRAADLERGFLLLDDLGSTCYLDALGAGADPEPLYRDALEALATLQRDADPDGLPDFDEARLRAELELFPDWLLERHLGVRIGAALRERLESIFARLCAACLEQPRVFVHRDYHSRNLMVVGAGGPGILDFQDAVRGPLVYDAVSLLRDVYVDWPRARLRAWLAVFHRLARDDGAGPAAGVDRPTLERWFDLTAAQRLLKVAGIFARLYHRDAKARYLADVPRTLAHLRASCARRPELADVTGLLDDLEVERRLARANAAVEALAPRRGRGRA